MTQYEYEIIEVKRSDLLLGSELNDLGRLGWRYKELIYAAFGSDVHWIVMEREKSEQTAVKESRPCPTCEGQMNIWLLTDDFTLERKDCPHCNATGRIFV